MSRWFRFHADAMRNPKVGRLSDKEFRLWVELLCVAADNDGLIPCLDDLKHVLKRRLDHLSTGVDRLISVGLIECLEDGYAPHDWNKSQYKSDVSTDRVKKHREKRNVSETPPDTDTDTETETYKEPKGSSASEDAPLTASELLNDWNELAGELGLPKAEAMSKARKAAFLARCREFPGLEPWRRAFASIRGSPFLRGQNDKGWKADIDFLLQAKSFTKLIEGSYGQA